jgi:membrane protease YdiL (CAAX protease family)
VVEVFLIGIVLGYLYIITGSLYLTIGLHFGIDSFFTLINVNNENNSYTIKSALNFHMANCLSQVKKSIS